MRIRCTRVGSTSRVTSQINGLFFICMDFSLSENVGGLWPAVWLLGNLGRATYVASTNNLWPWSYDKCDRKKQESQTISACNEANHFGLNKFQGRGATEIDVLELMGGELHCFCVDCFVQSRFILLKIMC